MRRGTTGIRIQGITDTDTAITPRICRNTCTEPQEKIVSSLYLFKKSSSNLKRICFCHSSVWRAYKYKDLVCQSSRIISPAFTKMFLTWPDNNILFILILLAKSFSSDRLNISPGFFKYCCSYYSVISMLTWVKSTKVHGMLESSCPMSLENLLRTLPEGTQQTIYTDNHYGDQE